MSYSILLLTGCVGGPLVLHETVMSYDRSISQINAELLLTNIARVRSHRPIHFTTVSSVAATFNFAVSAQGSQGKAPLLGGAYEENPTITIIPVEGEEFNQRVLNPFTETKFLLLMQQGTDLGMLLRMSGAELRLDSAEGLKVLRNRPGRPAEFEEFRRCVLHLVALHELHELFIAPVVIEQNITVASTEDRRTSAVIAALDEGYRWSETENGSTGVLTRNLAGRTVISNYDTGLLQRDERRQLFLKTKALAVNEVYVDIRPGFRGGEHPIRGVFRLRSFLGVLGFLARSLGEEPEFAVEQRFATDRVLYSPVQTLGIVIGKNPASNAAHSVLFEGVAYSIPKATDQATVWNLEAFRLLLQIYELSVRPAEFSKPAPAITIAK